MENLLKIKEIRELTSAAVDQTKEITETLEAIEQLQILLLETKNHIQRLVSERSIIDNELATARDLFKKLERKQESINELLGQQQQRYQTGLSACNEKRESIGISKFNIDEFNLEQNQIILQHKLKRYKTE